MNFKESTIEEAVLTWFGELDYEIGHGSNIAPSEPVAERNSFGDVMLVGRLRESIRNMDPAIPIRLHG
jgi:type I restriction enzyme R subunit